MKGKVLPAAPPAPEEGPVLSKAVVRAAGLLGLTQRQLAEILGVSEPTASRLAAVGLLLLLNWNSLGGGVPLYLTGDATCDV